MPDRLPLAKPEIATIVMKYLGAVHWEFTTNKDSPDYQLRQQLVPDLVRSNWETWAHQPDIHPCILLALHRIGQLYLLLSMTPQIGIIIPAFVKYVQQADIYHIYKHKRRLCPAELTEQEKALSHRRRPLHTLHRKLTDPWRAFRRKFLATRHAKGLLVSPTEELEDHYQPEKATWRQQKGADE